MGVVQHHGDRREEKCEENEREQQAVAPPVDDRDAVPSIFCGMGIVDHERESCIPCASSNPGLSPRVRANYRRVMSRPQRTCHCGYAKGHELIVEEPEYTLWGWILLSMFGITPKPDHVVYRCQMCRKSVGSTRDPRVLAGRTQTTPDAPSKPSRPESPRT